MLAWSYDSVVPCYRLARGEREVLRSSDKRCVVITDPEVPPPPRPRRRRGQICRGQIRRGQICRGQIRRGQICRGQTRRGQICRGQIRRGQICCGQTRREAAGPQGRRFGRKAFTRGPRAGPRAPRATDEGRFEALIRLSFLGPYCDSCRPLGADFNCRYTEPLVSHRSARSLTHVGYAKSRLTRMAARLTRMAARLTRMPTRMTRMAARLFLAIGWLRG